MAAEVEKWGLFEAAFPGPKDGNPSVDVTLDVDFGRENRRMTAPGFYDGDGLYRVRFMPDTEGEWTFRTRSNAPALEALSGRFRCGPPSEGNHGPVRVRNRHHFAYADDSGRGCAHRAGWRRGPNGRRRCAAADDRLDA